MKSDSGIGAMEIVIVVAVVGIVALTAFAATGSPTGHFSAYSRALVAARALAVAAQVPVAVSNGASCPGALEAVSPGAPGVVTLTFPSRGLLFTPDGLPRTCDGGGVGNTTILLEHRGRQAAVIVSSLGRVRWEMR